MILLNGCSFSYGDSLKEPKKYRYSTFLEKRLDTQIRNIAEASKDNFTMYFELHTYLNYVIAGKQEKPEIIIWQLTDTFRKSLPDWKASGSWIPGNINSLIGRYHKRNIKTIMWSKFQNIKSKYKKILDTKGEQEARKYKEEVGMGSKVLAENHSFLFGDETFIHNELWTGLHISTIQDLCDKLDIRLIIVNYYGTPANVLKDPIYSNINRDNYLIENSEKWGLYNHLMFRGFDRPDDFHFNVDGHYYQSDILYDYIVHNKRLKVEEESHPDISEFPVFDYTGTSIAGKNFLVKYATTRNL